MMVKKDEKNHNEFLAACEISCGRKKSTSLTEISIDHLYKNKQAFRRVASVFIELIMHNLLN